MDIDIRSHIINNFKGDNKETLKSTIEDSIKDSDEITLPGEGVFFEIIWNSFYVFVISQKISKLI